MRHVICIFLKDARRLGGLSALGLALVYGWAATESWQSDASPGWLGAGLHPLVTGVWMLLVALLVQEDGLVGDRQYWLTRPYSRVGLVLSKALFVVVFVHGPYLVACAGVLWARGFAPWEELGALWERQMMVAGLVTIPSAAVASVTRTFAQFAGGMLMLAAGGMVLAVGRGPYSLPWLNVDVVRRLAGAMLLGAAGIGVLAMQYRWRRTGTASVVGFAGVLFTGAVFAWTPALYTEGLGCRLGGVSLMWRKTETKPDPRAGYVWGRDSYSAQVELRGTASGEVRHARMLAFSMLGPDGQEWGLGRSLAAHVETWGTDDERLRVLVGSPVAESVRGRRVTLRGAFKVDVNVAKQVERMEIGGPARMVEWVGRCGSVVQSEDGFLNRDMLKVFCESPARVPILAKVVLRGSGEEIWEQRLGAASVHYGGWDWLSPLDRKQTFFPIVEGSGTGSGNKWVVPRAVLAGARVELMPEEPAGCAVVRFETAGVLDGVAGRFVAEVK
ncbi:MAG: hypothetical protein U0R19_27355 [Bryobacteraceae bacterium]